MTRLVGGDRYDLAAVACVLVGVLLALVVGPWYLWLIVGFVAGNLVGAALRRRAGVPDRSALGRLRGAPAPSSHDRPDPRATGDRASSPPVRIDGPSPTRQPSDRPRVRRAGTEWREGRRRSR